ncbi:PREDICTED: uncharacterized protein LOC106107785 [Papilio polytes]|uniref:uncharacterized protein LOC106107785 n=1 Tax=Papilio polytes TaxID=76194 RepID=UPI0006765DEC|nr:PREDICTED: uncharacterized protein LOC106107785 [Papilio polytes]
MSGLEDDPKLKGLSRYFNSQTDRGRANVSKVTMSLVAMYYVYYKLTRPRSKFIIRMAGDSVDDSQLKGLSKYFNSQTNRGRANTAKATYAVFGALILYYTLKPKSKK